MSQKKQYYLAPKTIELLELSAHYFGLPCCGETGDNRENGRSDRSATCSLAQYMTLNETRQEQI